MTDAGGRSDIDPSPGASGAEDFDPGVTVIRLGQFLKLAGLVNSGGEAKLRIGDGEVTVNGMVETRRRRQLKNGDLVAVDGTEAVVDLTDDEAADDADGASTT